MHHLLWSDFRCRAAHDERLMPLVLATIVLAC
jgi:hypothetical protein